MNEDNRKKVYDVLKSQTGYRDSYEDFNKAFDANEENRKRVYDVLKSQTGYLDSYEDFSKGMGYQSSTNTASVLNDNSANPQRQPAQPPFDATTRLMELMEENKPSLGELVRKNGTGEQALAKKRDTSQVPIYENARHMADRMRQDQAMRSEMHDYRPMLMEPVGKKKNAFELEEERRIDEQYHPKKVETEADVLENYRNRFVLSLRGGRLDNELAQKRGEVQEKHFQAFAQSPEYQDLLQRGASSEEISEKFYQQHGNAMSEEMRPYEDAFGKEMMSRYKGRIQEELAQLQKLRSTDQLETLAKEVDELSQQTHKSLQRRAPSSGNAMNALMGSRNHVQSSEEERRQAGILDAAQRLIEQSKEIVTEAGKKGRTNFVAGLWLGLRDNMDWENFTFGLADMADARYLHDALEKYERGETLSAAEQKLLEASAVNMAIQGFYSSDLGRGYNAGRVTAESIPFMLEFAINPISGSGNAIAKSLLKFGLRRFGRAGSFAARAGGATGAALGMTGTTGAPRVAGNTMERLNQNYEYYLDENDNLHVQKTGDVGTMEALGKSIASTALENQSEMILNAFRVFRPYLRQINDALPGGVNAFMQRMKDSRAGQLYREIKNNPTLREAMRRTQIQGLPQEYLEEVYNNFASIPLGDMTFEDVVDLNNNLDIIFGLTPTFLAFGLLGAGGMATERYQNRKRMERIFGKMTAEQRKKFEELQQMSKVNGNEEIKDFIKTTMADPELTQEQKREAIEYAFALAKQNDMDEIQDAETQDKIDAETQDIVANSDQATNTYTECNRIVVNDVGEMVEVPGHIVGYMSGQPLWKPDGAGPEVEAIPLKEGEYNPESIQSMPVQEVIDETAQAIREDAEAQAQRESTYSPDIVPYNQLEPGMSSFYDKDGNLYSVGNIDTDTKNFMMLVTSPEGKQIASRPFSEEEYLSIRQTQIDAQEQQTAVKQATDGVSTGNERRLDETGTQQPLTLQQQEVESIRQAGVDEEVIRNTIDDRVKKAKSALDKAERQAKAPIKDAQTVKEEMASRKKALDEARAVYEGWNALLNPEAAQQAQQAQADAGAESIPQGSSLTSEEADALLTDMKNRAEVAPELELTIENWDAQFGTDGLVQTPIGEVKMGENQFAKMMRQGRNGKLGMVKPTLENPDAIIEDKGGNIDENSVERASSYIFVKAFAKPDGGRYYYFTSVTVSKDGREVVVSNQEKSQKRISKLLKQNPVAWISDKFSLHPITQIEGSVPLSETNKPTQTDNRPALLGVNSPKLSEDKGTNHPAENQTSVEETIPADEKGNPLYHRAPVERTVASINAEGLEPDEADAFIQANKDAAAKQLKQVEAKAPKMGTSIAKYKADKAAWQARVADAQAQVDYWNQVGDAIAAQRTQVGDTTAEDIRAMGEPMNGHELAAMMLATGRLPLLQSDFKRETGYKGDEARSLFGLFASEANGGMTIERAGEQLMLADLEAGTNFFDQADPNAGRNVLLDVLSEVRTRGDLANYIRRNRETVAERERQAEYDAYADWCDEVMHMTPEEYEAYQEYIAENNPYEGIPVEELDRIFAEAEESYHNNIISQDNEQGTSENGSSPDSGPSERDEPAGETGGREAGVPVLPEAQPLLQGQEPGRAGGTEAASRPADDGVRPAEGTVSEGASGGEGAENRADAGDNEINVVSSQRNQTEEDNGTVSEPVPQGEHRTEAPQDSRMEEAAAELRTRVEAAARDAQASGRTLSERQRQEIEQRAAESYAKETGQWIPMADTFAWQPMPSGNENNVYLNTEDGHVYKVNNLMNSKGILPLFERIQLHNQLFPESKYEFVGFTGFDRGSVYPVFRQEYVNDATFATPEEIDSYMQSLGFHRTGEAEYSNDDITISDLRPRNVLKDTDGDLYVIDADFRRNERTGHAAPERQDGENLLDYAERIAKIKEIDDARKEVSANPTDAQKEAGNYKKGHITLDGYDITIENPKGSTRSGVDANGQPWSVTMNNDYGYIRGTEGVDGDHIDVFLSDDPTTGKVYVIDQVKEDGTFDEHKVMYGFKSALAAKRAYLANYSPGWKGLGTISEISKEEFKKWVDSSHRKTKPFAEYKKVKVEGAQNEPLPAISQEMDENGHPFVLASDGTSTFGNITEETGLPAAPIKLSEGFQSEDGKGYGLAHIEYRHGEQIRNAGFPSIEAFVEDVAKNFTVIKRGNARGTNETYLLEVQDAHNNTLFVELSQDGSYWNVNSAGVFKKGYSKKKAIVWTVPALGSSTNADATEVYHGQSEGETVTSGDSSQTISSDDKGSDSSSNGQTSSGFIARTLDDFKADRESVVQSTVEDLKDEYATANLSKTDEEIRKEAEELVDYNEESDLYMEVWDRLENLVGSGHMDELEADARRNGEDRLSLATMIDELERRIGTGNLIDRLKEIGDFLPPTGLYKDILYEYAHLKRISTDEARKAIGNKTASEIVKMLEQEDTNKMSSETITVNREQEAAEKVKQQSGPVEKIEDVGEKIGGAKKDRFKEFAEKEKQLQEKPDSFMEELRKLPVSKIFNFNLEALRKDGLSNEAATLIDVIRRVIPSKPRTDWKLKRWVSDVFGLYRFCLTLATAEQGRLDQVLERVSHIKQIGGMYRAQMALGGFDSGLDTGQATLEELGEGAGHYDKDDNWVSIKGQWYVNHAGRYGGIYPDYEKAKEALAKFAGENTQPKEKGAEVKFSVYSYKHSGEAFITPKGKPGIVVESGFKSSQEALDYLNEHMDELQAKYRNMKDATSIGFAPNGERRGKDWRGGKDVTAEDFRNTFGFRGVEFGNWANQQERQRALNQAYDAFMDLSEATGISPQGLSLGGELGMAFGARGGGGAAAHYEPGKVVINLTKTQGAGTLAHEWWHAIDNYFSRRRGQALGYNTERKGYKLPVRGGRVEREHEAERKEITDAFTALMKAINGSSYGERSNAYAGLKSSYWKEPTELGARAFAVWVERKLSEKGIVNNFLANNNTIGWESPELTQKYYPYPLESDFESLDVAFDNLFGAIEEKVDEETGNTILYRNGAGFLSDDALSAANDPVSKLLGQSTRTAKQRRAFAERERRNMASRMQELAEKLHLGNVEIVNEPMAITDREGKTHYPKGFYNRATDKIVIVIPNNSSVFDAEQTLLHEAVAHYGLRQLFGEHFDTFLDNVFGNADVEVRRQIVALAKENGWNTHVATEEYLASLAENTNFEDLDASWWRKIKDLFLRMLHKIGFENFSGVTLTDNELRYILWRSYENLRAPGSRRSILGQAEDIAKQYELKVGNYAPTEGRIGQVAEGKGSVKAERIRKLRESKPVEITGNEYQGKYELNRDSAQKYVLDNLRGEYTIKDTGEKVNLSKVGAKKVTSHSMGNEAHLKSIAAIPQLISNAIFIEERPPYKEGAQYDSYRYYVTGLKINGEDYTVRMTIGVKNGKYYYDHYLTNIEKGNLIEIAQGFTPTEDAPNPSYADDKGSDTNSVMQADEIEKGKLLSIIPTIQKAGMEGNSPLSGIKDKRLLSILQADAEENLLFRETPDGNEGATSQQNSESMNDESPSPLSTPIVEAWDKLANSFKFQLRETAVDYLTAVEKFQELVAKYSGKAIQSFENAYNLMLSLSSKTKNEMDMFDSFFVKPLNQAILKLVGASYGLRKWNWDKGPLRELVMYVEAKHGAERNRQMAVEKLAKEDASGEAILKDWSEAKKRINAQQDLSWMEKQRLLDEEAAKLGADLSKDYSGLSSVFKDKEKYPKGWKESAWEYVEQYEKGHDGKDIEALWTAVSNATGYALQKQYESGLVSKEYVERQKERFDNYIPLRGFADEIAGDVYNYMGHDFYPGGNPVKKAEGRTSEAGNPFGSILNTAYASMATGNKNMAKLALYSLVVNHDTGGLAVVNRAWMVRYDDLKNNEELSKLLVIPKIPAGEETPEWVEAVPKMPEKATAEEITQVMERFKEAMNKYQQADVTKPIGKKAKTAYRTLYHERDQHDIPLYIAGDKYVITVTGNPRLAQAMNGLLNPDVNNDSFTEIGKRIQRGMSGAFTAKNAAFAIANLFKDSQYANNQAFIRENPKYWVKFTENQRLGFGDFIPMMRRLHKYRTGKLDMNNETDRLFKEFMDNGGATGYTFVNSQDEYARELAKRLKDLSRKTPEWFTPKGLLKLFFDLVEFAGQSAELVNRFAAYKTGRQMGRGITRSVRDAKEITVNFNRKGAGRKSADLDKSWYSPINIASAISQCGRAHIIFWNANMQAKYRLYKNLKEHPVKTSTTLIANNMALGAVAIPLLNNIVLPALFDIFGLSSGDDDEDYYDVLTDWERTHNICIRLPYGNWLKIPLSPEMSPWYSMGDAIFGAASGKRDISATDFIKSTIDAVSPLSINWSYGDKYFLLNFLPTVGQPIAQVMLNTNFMGNPLYKTPFNAKQGFTPEYKMVYRSASPALVELSRLNNRLWGGSDLKTSGKWSDWNPATLQNLISGFTGGYGTTILSVADWIVGTSQGEKQAVTFSRMPLVSRFVISGNKDVKLRRINSSFYQVRDFVNEFEYDRKALENAIQESRRSGDMLKMADYISQLEELWDSDRAKKYVQLKDFVDASKHYEDYLDEFPEDETTRNLLYGIKMEGIERLRE